MLKTIALLSLASVALAQSGTTPPNTMKKATAPAHAASGPTKVSGPPTKTADGLAGNKPIERKVRVVA